MKTLQKVTWHELCDCSLTGRIGEIDRIIENSNNSSRNMKNRLERVLKQQDSQVEVYQAI